MTLWCSHPPTQQILCLVVKWLEHETGHSLIVITEVENVWYRMSSPLYIFIACSWIMGRQLSFYITLRETGRHLSTAGYWQHCNTCYFVDRTRLYSSVCGLCTEIRNTGGTLTYSDRRDSLTHTDNSLKMTGCWTLVLVSSQLCFNWRVKLCKIA